MRGVTDHTLCSLRPNASAAFPRVVPTQWSLRRQVPLAAKRAEVGFAMAFHSHDSRGVERVALAGIAALARATAMTFLARGFFHGGAEPREGRPLTLAIFVGGESTPRHAEIGNNNGSASFRSFQLAEQARGPNDTGDFPSTNMTEGTVKVWQNESGYRLFPLAAPDELPSRAQGVFVIMDGAKVLLIDLIEQVYSPAKAIDRGAARPDVKPHAPTHAAILQVNSWNEAVVECRRLRAFYDPLVKLRVR